MVRVESATVSISAGFVGSEDVLAFSNTANITGSYNATTGVLSLTGSDTGAAYEAALESVTYQNTNIDDPNTDDRTISFVVNDGDADAVAVTGTVTVAGDNDAPVLTGSGQALVFTEGDGPTAIDPALGVTDVDDVSIESATVSISAGFVSTEDLLTFTDTANIRGSYDAATGTLTLTGSDTKAAYEAALQSVAYQNTNLGNPDTAARTISFEVNDGDVSGSVVTATVTVDGANDAPGLAGAGETLAYVEGDGAVVIDATLDITDVDDDNIESATVSITGGLVVGEDLLGFANTANIVGVYDAAAGVLTLTGADSKVAYEAALESVTYQNTNTSDPDVGVRTVTFEISDGDSTGAAIGTVQVTRGNDAPIISGSSATTAYQEGDAATIVDGAIAIVDGDSENLESATVSITSGFVAFEDVLDVTGTANISGSFDAATGVLTLTGTDSKAAYEAVLESVTYRNADLDSPEAGARTISFVVNDGEADSVAASSTVIVAAVNDAPTARDSSLTMAENSTLVFGLADFDIDDPDADDVTGVRILTVTGAGSLQLNGVDVGNNVFVSRGEIEAGRLQFVPTTGEFGASYAAFDFTASDGIDDSGPATVTVNVIQANEAPVAGNSRIAAQEDQPYVFSRSDFSFTDRNPADTLQFLTVEEIATNGTLELSGSTVTRGQSISVADIDAGNLVFRAAPDASGTDYATFEIRVHDGAASSVNSGTVVIDVAPVDDAGSGQVAILGDARSGSTVSADTSSLADPDGIADLTFQWLRNGSAIVGATSSDYTLLADDVGAELSVLVQMIDEGGSVEARLSETVSVAAPAVPPLTGSNDSAEADEDTVLNVASENGVLANDLGSGDDRSLTVLSVSSGESQAAPGQAIAGTNGGTFVVNLDGSYSFEPGDDFQSLSAGQMRVTSVLYQVADESGQQATLQLDVSVRGVNDLTVSDADLLQTTSSQFLSTSEVNGVLANDSDPDADDRLSVVQIRNGSASVAADQTIEGSAGGSFTVRGDGSFQFLPGVDFDDLEAGQTRATQVTYVVSDGAGGEQEQTLTVVVVGETRVASPGQGTESAGNSTESSATESATSPERVTEAPASDATTESTTAASTESSAVGETAEDRAAASASADGEPVAEDEPAVPILPEESLNPDTATGFTSGFEVSNPDTPFVPPGLTLQQVLYEPSTETGASFETESAERLRTDLSSIEGQLATVSSTEYQRSIDRVRDEAMQEIEERERVVGGGFVFSAGLSVGYVIWLARSGILLSSVLSSLPAWRLIDPLPILSTLGTGTAEDDESIESIVRGDETASDVEDSDEDRA